MENKEEKGMKENKSLYTDENRVSPPISYEEAQRRIAEQVARIESVTMKTKEQPLDKNNFRRKSFLYRFCQRVKNIFRK